MGPNIHPHPDPLTCTVLGTVDWPKHSSSSGSVEKTGNTMTSHIQLMENRAGSDVTESAVAGDTNRMWRHTVSWWSPEVAEPWATPGGDFYKHCPGFFYTKSLKSFCLNFFTYFRKQPIFYVLEPKCLKCKFCCCTYRCFFCMFLCVCLNFFF